MNFKRVLNNACGLILRDSSMHIAVYKYIKCLLFHLGNHCMWRISIYTMISWLIVAALQIQMLYLTLASSVA